eukprot:5656560-Prymnesium_polylepis.1
MPPPGSVVAGMEFLDTAAWMAPLRVAGMTWQQIPSTNAVYKVKLCDCSSAPGSAAEKQAEKKLLDLVHGVPGNETFAADYDVKKTVLVDSRARATQLANMAFETNAKYANKA